MPEEQVAELKAQAGDLQARVARLEAWIVALEDGARNMVDARMGERVLFTPARTARLAEAKGRA